MGLLLFACGGEGANTTSTTHNISGSINGAVLQGVTLTVTGGATAFSGINGDYIFSGLADGGYTITPALTGYTFSPASSAVSLNGANVSNTDFAASANPAPTYTLSGTVTGAILQNVLITLSGAGNATTLTNASGNFSFSGLTDGSYTVTPSLAAYTFSPTSSPVTISGANATVGNFVSARISKVFALMDVPDSTTTLTSFTTLATVDGLAFRTLWAKLEPTNSVYDWTTLDAAFDIVRAQGKQLTLHIGASSIGVPSWLAGLGTTSYTYTPPMGGPSVTEPIPWDAIFISRHTQFVAALAAHVQNSGNTSLLYAVSDGVPVAEMSIVGCLNGSLTGGTLYNRTSYLDAWKSTINAYATGFPDTRLMISAPVGVICRPDNDGKAFYTDVMNHAFTKSTKATLFAADLNALGSSRLAQVDSTVSAQAALTFQMIWSSTNDSSNRMGGTLKSAVCSGLTSGARYFEIYKVDILSADATIQDAIQAARLGQPC